MRRLWRDRRGGTAVLVAISLPVMLAVGGLGVDVGWWYTVKRQNQSAADAAAVSAAYEVKAGKTSVSTNLVPAAKAAANQNEASQYQISTLNGVSANPGGTPATTCADPGGSYVCYQYSDTIVSSGVLVVLRQQQTGWLSNFGSLANLTIANRAVAAVVNLAPSCLYLLNQSGKDLVIQGSASLTMPSCSICVDSTASDSIYAQGAANAILTADALITAGGISTTGSPNITTTFATQTGAAGCPDPYASTLAHSFLTSGMPTTGCGAATSSAIGGQTWWTYPGNCVITNTANNGNQATLSQSNIILQANTVFQGGFNIKGQVVNLSPGGTYWIADNNFNLDSGATLECTTCVPGGAGVTIILTTTHASGGGSIGSVNEQGNPTVDSLNAPGSGTYQNLLLIQDSNGLPTGTTPPASGGSTFQGTGTAIFDGLVYFPDQPITFQGNPSATNSCLIVVAGSVTLAGNSSMAATGCPTSGPGAVQQLKTVALVE